MTSFAMFLTFTFSIHTNLGSAQIVVHYIQMHNLAFVFSFGSLRLTSVKVKMAYIRPFPFKLLFDELISKMTTLNVSKLNNIKLLL